MQIEGTVYCEAEGCEVHQHVGPTTMAAGRLPIGWVVLRFFEDHGRTVEYAFHEPECAMKWIATNTEPAQIIEVE